MRVVLRTGGKISPVHVSGKHVGSYQQGSHDVGWRSRDERDPEQISQLPIGLRWPVGRPDIAVHSCLASVAMALLSHFESVGMACTEEEKAGFPEPRPAAPASIRNAWNALNHEYSDAPRPGPYARFQESALEEITDPPLRFVGWPKRNQLSPAHRTPVFNTSSH